MENQDWAKVETIIDKALTLSEPERQDYIEEACKGDKDLKGEVTQLLESIFASESKKWLENPVEVKSELFRDFAKESITPADSESMKGRTIGSYTITKLLGEGGMGQVYLAERSDGSFEHQVAIKIIRESRATKTNIDRFRQEQNILAELNHPGIAKLFDGGITDDGFPYLIMEYVDGVPIDQFCRNHELSPHQHIELFIKILEAIRHAHENLVVHRDLKPGNILITSNKEVKILDFGISKLLAAPEDQSLTQTQTRLLTPKYAAPEQIKQQPITTATDIYSLGIIFYQLLCQTLPFDFENISSYEIEQLVLKQQPAPPSTNVASGKITPNQLKGDLDAIILKAIRKEPEERYRGISELLEDLNNYQKGLPVSALKGTTVYRTKKFFKRHKKGTALAAGVFLLIVSLVGFYTNRVEDERKQAELSAAQAEETKDFLLNIFNTTNPEFASYSGNDISAKTLLKNGVEEVDASLWDQPSAYVELLSSIGSALKNLTAYPSSEEAYEKALTKSEEYYGTDHPQTASILAEIATLKRSQGQREEAENLIVQSIEILEQKETEASLSLANKYSIYAFTKAYQGEYSEALNLFQKADSLYIASGNEGSLHRFTTLDNRAETEARMGKYEDAEEHLYSVLDFYQNHYKGSHFNIAQTFSSLGALHSNTSDYKKSNAYLYKSIEMKKELLGEDHIDLASTYDRLAINYRELNELDRGEKFARQSLKLNEEAHGEHSIQYAETLNNLALIQLDRNQLREAKSNYEQIIATKKKLLEPTHTSMGVAYYNYASVLQDLGSLSEAKNYFEKTIEIDKATYGPNHPGVAIDYNALASVLTELNDYEKADSLFSLSESIYQETLPPTHYRIGQNLVEHSKLLYIQEEYTLAQDKLNKAIDIYKQSFKENDPRIEEAIELLDKCNEQIQNVNSSNNLDATT